MSDPEIASLGEVDLPEQGHWVAFLAASELWVLRADPDHAWTLLCKRGHVRGRFRRAGQRFRIVGERTPTPAVPDWRDAVRRLCARPPSS